MSRAWEVYTNWLWKRHGILILEEGLLSDAFAGHVLGVAAVVGIIWYLI